MLPHMDLLYAGAVAEQRGASVRLLDIGLEGWQGDAALSGVDRTIAEAHAGSGPLWIAVQVSMPSLLHDLAFARAVKDRHPESRLFLVGNAIMTTLDHWIDRAEGVDAIVFGEPEEVIAGMLDAPDGDWKSAKGVVDPTRYQGGGAPSIFDAGMVRTFENWVRVRALADLPHPAWHLVPFERYSPTGNASDCAVFVQASRGCPIGCTMCPYMVHEGRPFRPNDPDRVVAELLHLNRTYGITKVRFRDPNFGFDKRQMRSLCRKIVEAGVRLEAAAELSLELCDFEDLDLLHAAGIRTMLTGIETNDEACLASIGQKIRINDNLAEKISYCDKIGMKAFGSFVVGAPEEDWDSLQRTVDYAKLVNAQCSATIMTPFPGTPMFYRAIAEGLMEPRMQYDGWNSYTATMRTYALDHFDLTVARLWFRMEAVIPYRLRQAAKRGAGAVAKTWAGLLPRFAMRAVLRSYVAVRRMVPARRVAPPADQAAQANATDLRRALWQDR